MKLLLIAPVFSLVILTGFNPTTASHIVGGHITSAPVSGQNYQYEIKITLYSQAGSPVELGSLELDLGTGEPQYVEPSDYTIKPFNNDSLYFITTFLVRHTYPGPGKYLISLRKYNRTGESVNMVESGFTPFYIETLLSIDPLSGNNSTPELAAPSAFEAPVKTRFVHNIWATDPDGDSLSFALVVPKQHKEKYVDHYYFPHRLGISSSHPPAREDGSFPAQLYFQDGQLIWDAPAYGGLYTFAFQVKEWRKVEGEWKETGYVTRDISIFIQDTINHTNGSDYITATYDERGKQAVQLFPNPTDGPCELTIHEQWYDSHLIIRDVLGRKVHEVPVLAEKTSFLNLQHLSTGLYVLLLQKGLQQRSLTFVKR